MGGFEGFLVLAWVLVFRWVFPGYFDLMWGRYNIIAWGFAWCEVVLWFWGLVGGVLVYGFVGCGVWAL